MSSDMTMLDGNAAAGDLREIFAVDVSAAICRCDHCGRVCAIAETRMYRDAPGMILRCSACEHVLVRFTRSGARLVLDMRGVSYLSVEAS